jgi:hypothetical protein
LLAISRRCSLAVLELETSLVRGAQAILLNKVEYNENTTTKTAVNNPS